MLLQTKLQGSFVILSTCKSILHASSYPPPPLNNTHICSHRPPPTQSHAHSNTPNKHTQTPPSTPPTVTTSGEWSACGEVVVKTCKGSGDTLLLLTPKRLMISCNPPPPAHNKRTGTLVLRVPVQPPIHCWDVGSIISLGWSQDGADMKPAGLPCHPLWVESLQMSSWLVG